MIDHLFSRVKAEDGIVVYLLQGEEGIRVYKVTGVLTCFFLKEEDGIRDYKVTGVQTCALPISGGAASAGGAAPPWGDGAPRPAGTHPTLAEGPDAYRHLRAPRRGPPARRSAPNRPGRRA